MFGASEEMRVEYLQSNAMELVYLICSVIAQPVEILLRPWYGTRYYPVPVTFFSAAMMLLLPGIMLLFSNFMRMIPLLHVPQPVGMFALGDDAKLYFLAQAVHGVRLWRRMIFMERETHSQYEGPALPLFQLLPKGKSFWFVRIVLEPAFVLVLAIVLQDLFIAQSNLALYLKLAALALLMKQFFAWFRAWEYIRQILDTRIAALSIARLAEGQASEAELEPLHLASIPQNIDPEIRKATIAHVARSYMQE
jgi:hypothetical protein